MADGRDSPGTPQAGAQRLDAGDSTAIALALALRADMMLMDDHVAVARLPARTGSRSPARSASSALQAAAS
jgi:hypothetical protein